MSDIIFAFDPTTGGQASFPAPNSAANGTLVFWNESNVSQIINLNGNNFYLPAWYNRHFTGAAGNVNVLWQVHTVLNSGQVPTSEVIIEAYYEGEEYPADGPLVRQANGNTNSTVSGANTVVNTTNVPGSNWLDIQPTDAASATFSADNSGNFSVFGDNAGILTSLLQLISGASPRVKLAAIGIFVEVLGNLEIDQVLTWGSTPSASNQLMNLLQGYGLYSDNVGTLGTTRIWLDGPDRGEFHVGPRGSGNWLDEVSFRTTELEIILGKNTSPNSQIFKVTGGPTQLDGGNVATNGSGSITLSTSGTPYMTLIDNGNGPSIDTTTGNNITLSINGVSVAYANHVTGNFKVTNALDLPVGGISRMFGQDGVACGSGTTISHSMGITPDVIVASPNGGQPFSATVGVGNIGATTFRATVGAGSAIDWLGWNI